MSSFNGRLDDLEGGNREIPAPRIRSTLAKQDDIERLDAVLDLLIEEVGQLREDVTILTSAMAGLIGQVEQIESALFDVEVEQIVPEGEPETPDDYDLPGEPERVEEHMQQELPDPEALRQQALEDRQALIAAAEEANATPDAVHDFNDITDIPEEGITLTPGLDEPIMEVSEDE